MQPCGLCNRAPLIPVLHSVRRMFLIIWALVGKLFSEGLACGRGRRFFALDLRECCGHRASQDFRKMNLKADCLLWQNNSYEFAFLKSTGNKACVYRMLQLYLQCGLDSHLSDSCYPTPLPPIALLYPEQHGCKEKHEAGCLPVLVAINWLQIICGETDQKLMITGHSLRTFSFSQSRATVEF